MDPHDDIVVWNGASLLAWPHFAKFHVRGGLVTGVAGWMGVASRKQWNLGATVWRCTEEGEYKYWLLEG